MNLHKYITVAKAVASLSKDSTQVGCLIIDKRGLIRAIGYNGFPRGIADDPERYADSETKHSLVAHAETNAITNAASVGTPLLGCSLVVTKHPCNECAKSIINAGITHILCPHPAGSWAKSNAIAANMFREAGVYLNYYEANP